MNGPNDKLLSAHNCDALPKGDDDGRRFVEILEGEVTKSYYDRCASGYIALGKTIAHIQLPSPERERFAALFCAAPDLLAELIDLRKRFHRACEHAGSDAEYVAGSTPGADAAIARATGDRAYEERVG